MEIAVSPSLLVKNEFLVALDMMAMLNDHGYRVIGPAGTVAESMALIDADKPDLAILDYRLRGSVVTPLADRLNRMSIPFVMATASEVEELGKDSPLPRLKTSESQSTRPS